MPALSAKFDPDSTSEKRDVLDIRTRLLMSLVVTLVTLYLSSNTTLAAMSAITFAYLLQTKRYAVIVSAYLLMLLMSILSLGIIYGSSRLFLWLLPVNVLLAIGLNFSVQGFVGTMKSVRLPRFLFLPLLVFCRFVPEFVDVVRQLRDAVRMRGFAVGFGSAILHPLQTIRLTVIPLIVRALRMADNLSIAAEMKRVGYARKPTQLCTLRFRKVDFVMLAVTAILSAGLCIWEANIPKPKRMPPRRSASMRPSQTVGSRIPHDRDGRAVAPRPPSADGAGRRPYQDSTKGSPK